MQSYHKYFVGLLLFLFALPIILINGCQKGNPVSLRDAVDGGSGKITLGNFTEVLSTIVDIGGGTIQVNKPGDPLDKFQMTVESNSYTKPMLFKISHAPIIKHVLGANFNPITPMISISYEGGYSDKPIYVKVPIKLPKDHFAMGYFYDDKTGKLEGLPIESLDSTSITISTRTFSSKSSLGKTNGISDGTSIVKMIISSVSESVLKSQSIIASGFLPGIDDWEFVNYGSYIASGGHCAGQSMTAMWYYYEKKLRGERSLFHKYDEVNDRNKPGTLWQDNPNGYRFASTIQKDFNFDGWILSLEMKSLFPKLIFNAFAASILLTGEPQFVLIRNSAGQGGHAMIVYKVNFNEGKLYIADPNYPNNRVPSDGTESIRTIDLVNGAFKPYETGLVAGGNSITMDQIGYFGKTSYIDWGQMAKRWIEFENKTIGNDRFPVYQLKIKNDKDKELFDQLVTDKDTLQLYCKSTASEEWLPNTDRYQPFYIYNDKGDFILGGDGNNGGIASIPLKPGLNKFGFYLLCGKNGKGRYTDFKWININKQNLKIDPDPLDGEPNKEYTFTAHSKGTAPVNAKYIWNFGDNTAPVTVNNDSTVKHTFTTEGTFIITVELYDNTNKLVGTASSNANISKVGDLLSQLHAMTRFWVDCSFNFRENFGSDHNGQLAFFRHDDDTLKWSGTSFSYDDAVETDFDGLGYKAKHYHYVSGTVSADGKTILEIKTKYIYVHYAYFKLFETRTEEMIFTNIPFKHYPGYLDLAGPYDDFLYKLEEDVAKSHVSFVKWTWVEEGGKTTVRETINFFWDPLTVYFKK